LATLKVLNGLLIRTGRLKKQDVGMIALNRERRPPIGQDIRANNAVKPFLTKTGSVLSRGSPQIRR
jgi:hypothetical protein